MITPALLAVMAALNQAYLVSIILGGVSLALFIGCLLDASRSINDLTGAFDLMRSIADQSDRNIAVRVSSLQVRPEKPKDIEPAIPRDYEMAILETDMGKSFNSKPK